MASSLLTNLVAYWKLDESSGNAADASGGGFTLTNNNTVGYAAALINNGANFGASNTNKSLTIANGLGIDGGNLSFSCWIKPTALPSSDSDPFTTTVFNFMYQANSTSSVLYGMHLANVSGTQRIYFARYKNGVDSKGAYGDFTTPTISFTHVAGTYDGTTLSIYINGALQANTDTSSGSGSGASTLSGLGRRGTVAFYPGMVDEAGVWSKTLTLKEVTRLYNNGIGRPYPFGEDIDVSETSTLTEVVSVVRTANTTTAETVTLTESSSTTAPSTIWSKQTKSATNSWTNQAKS